MAIQTKPSKRPTSIFQSWGRRRKGWRRKRSSCSSKCTPPRGNSCRTDCKTATALFESHRQWTTNKCGLWTGLCRRNIPFLSRMNFRGHYPIAYPSCWSRSKAAPRKIKDSEWRCATSADLHTTDTLLLATEWSCSTLSARDWKRDRKIWRLWRRESQRAKHSMWHTGLSRGYLRRKCASLNYLLFWYHYKCEVYRISSVYQAFDRALLLVETANLTQNHALSIQAGIIKLFRVPKVVNYSGCALIPTVPYSTTNSIEILPGQEENLQLVYCIFIAP